MNKYFTTKQIADITLVRFLFSELSLEDAEEFKQFFYDLVSDKQNKFIINMQKCSFIASITLGILVSFTRKVREKGGKAVFCCINKAIRAVFEVTKLDTIFECSSTEDEALSLFK